MHLIQHLCQQFHLLMQVKEKHEIYLPVLL
ncbi:unnamed protein product [Onchocerca flexuosa]|uniref:Uncharacterized protein n=1 Tax=Onchocerca flexuosa TaxID=387005 RepID=A0A183HXX7_9BILA|nr:unnamed protein product [Onchocerca flexuosa]